MIEYITCPLCNNYVLDENGQNNVIKGSLEDFYCRTKTNGDNSTTLHYYRVTVQGGYQEYTFYLPPFVLSWIEIENKLRIWNSTINAIDNSPWKYLPNTEFPEVLNWIKRLDVLKVFI